MIRVLIVEDETVLRKGILTLIDWAGLGCTVAGECQNGLEAKRFLEERKAGVDIVVTDIKMPGMDGLALCELLRERYPAVRTIILTAFSDFNYAQTALRLQVFDYVIKSGFVEELPRVVGRLAGEIRQERSREQTGAAPATGMGELALRGILSGETAGPGEVAGWLEALQIRLENFFALCFELHNLEPDSQEAVLRFLQLAFQHTQSHFFWLGPQSLLAVLSFGEASESDNLQAIIHICNEVLSTARNYMSFEIGIGVSNQHGAPGELRAAYGEAVSARGCLMGANRMGLYRDLRGDRPRQLPAASASAAALLELAAENDQEGCVRFLEALFREHYGRVPDVDTVRLEATLILAFCVQGMSDRVIDLEAMEAIERRFTACMARERTMQGILRLSVEAVRELMALETITQDSKGHLVAQVNQYLERNYRETVRLGEIAALLHINGSYLSRLFKSQTGNSVINTLNRLRVEKAKELLRTGRHRISEVGGLVGIEDPAYFSSVFAKYAGVSPKAYRQGCAQPGTNEGPGAL